MKLSEAILAGSAVTEPLMRQFQDAYYTPDGTRVVLACAIGAACYAVEPETFVDNMTSFRRIFGENVAGYFIRIDMDDFPKQFAHIQGGYRAIGGPLENVVVNLNDRYQLSREDIAAVLHALGF
jgi:hypothetical protein